MFNKDSHVTFFHYAWGVIEPMSIFNFIVGEFCVCGGILRHILYVVFLWIFSKAQAVRIKLEKDFLLRLICSERPPNAT